MNRNPVLAPPAPQPQPFAPPVEPRHDEARSPILRVMAMFLENVIGGFGVFLVVCVLYIAISAALEADVVIESMASVAGCLGVFVFGAACAFRAFRDEASEMIAAHGSRQDVAARVALERRCASLEAEAEKLRGEAQTKSYYDTLRAVEILLTTAFTERRPVSRDAMMKRGMTRAEWEAAVEIAKGAQVFDGKGQPVQGLTYDAAWAQALHFQKSGQGTYIVGKDGEPVKIK